MNRFRFVHLNVHSHFSINDGCASIRELVDAAIKDGMPGIAITDNGNMFGMMEFFDYNSSLKEVEVPASVNTLNTGVFAGCKDLERIVIHSENVEHFFSFPNTLLNGFGGSSWLAIAKNNEPWMNTIVFGKEVKRISLGNDKEKSNGKPYGRAHIQNVYCEGIIPPEGGIWQAGATLHVPKGCREVYASAKIWALYGDYIVDDIELSGIHHAQLKAQDSDAPTYDLQGRRVAHPKQGEIYIQKGKKIRK